MISLIFITFFILFFTLNGRIDSFLLSKVLIFWLIFYKVIAGTLISIGLPLGIVKPFIYFKDVIFVSIFLKVFLYKKKGRLHDNIDKIMILFLVITIAYLFVNNIPIALKLRAARPTLYLITTYFSGRYIFEANREGLKSFMKFYIILVIILSLWSLITCYIIGYDNFFSNAKYLYSYGKIADIGGENYYDNVFYTVKSISYSLNKYRLRDFNNQFLVIGNMLCIAIVLLASFLISKERLFKKNDKKIYLFLLITLLLSISRAATAFTLLFVVWAFRKDIASMLLIIIVGVIVLIYFADIIVPLYHRYYEHIFVNTWDMGYGHTGAWLRFIYELINYPMGHGFGYAGEFVKAQQLNVGGHSALMMQGTILSNTGILGLTVFTILHINIILLGFKIKKVDPAYGLILIGLSSTYYGIGLTKPGTFGWYYTLMVYFTIGIIINMYYKSLREENNGKVLV